MSNLLYKGLYALVGYYDVYNGLYHSNKIQSVEQRVIRAARCQS